MLMLLPMFLWAERGPLPFWTIQALMSSQKSTRWILAWQTTSQFPHPVHLYMASTNSELRVTSLPRRLSRAPVPTLSSWLM